MIKNIAIGITASAITYGIGWFATTQFVKRYHNFDVIIDELVQENPIDLSSFTGLSLSGFLPNYLNVSKRNALNEVANKWAIGAGAWWPVFWIAFVTGNNFRIRNVHEWPDQEKLESIKEGFRSAIA